MSRPKREYRTTSRENYDRFCAENPKIKLSFGKWISIIRTCNWMYVQHILDTGDILKLPHGFGDLTIVKRKTSIVDENGKRIARLPIDWKRTMEEGVTIYHLNFHSSGWRFKWFWQPKTSKLRQKQVWVLKPSRKASRTMAKYINKDTYYTQLYRELTR